MSSVVDVIVLLKLLHILGAAVLFGTGLGIAFFMFWADRSGDIGAIVSTARTVIVADFLFTATAVVLQPVTGVSLALVQGYALTEDWIVASLALYVMVGICWLPVVRLQMQMRDLAEAAQREDHQLPAAYHQKMRLWFWLGWPAFFGVMAIYWLMIAKPELW